MTVRDDKRTEELKLRLTERELLDLSRLAAAEGRPVADMARVLIRRALYGLPELQVCRPEPANAAQAEPRPKKVPRRRKEVFDASGGCCAYCGTALKLDGKWHVDHRMPRALLGSDEPGNLAASCVVCNLKKRDRTDAEFLALRAA